MFDTRRLFNINLQKLWFSEQISVKHLDVAAHFVTSLLLCQSWSSMCDVETYTSSAQIKVENEVGHFMFPAAELWRWKISVFIHIIKQASSHSDTSWENNMILLSTQNCSQSLAHVGTYSVTVKLGENTPLGLLALSTWSGNAVFWINNYSKASVILCHLLSSTDMVQKESNAQTLVMHSNRITFHAW